MIPAGVLRAAPGTGKTLLARCLAGEAQVPFFSCAGTEFMEMFVGVGAARIRNLFKQARDVKPCIVFIDEFDSVAIRRKDPTPQDALRRNDEQVATINQLLTEMDGFGGNAGVMVFAATNRPHVIDPALIRRGASTAPRRCLCPTAAHAHGHHRPALLSYGSSAAWST